MAHARALDVFEQVNQEVPFNGLHWFFDHCETITPKNIDRVKALGGGIAIQDRIAFQGEYFVERYGTEAAEQTPPIGRMLASGVPVGAGTDATRVASHNPWITLFWLVTGKTVGGLRLYPERNRLDRTTALRLYTEGSSWFSGEQGKKGTIAVGQYADLAVLSKDYLSVPEDDIRGIESVLTIVDGRTVWGTGDFKDLAPPLPPVSPDWSPVRAYGGYQQSAVSSGAQARATSEASGKSCGVHKHAHHLAWGSDVPISDKGAFWGLLGCSCFAF